MWEMRLEAFFLMDVSGGEASLCWINSFLEETEKLPLNELTAYRLIFNMFYTKQNFCI